MRPWIAVVLLASSSALAVIALPPLVGQDDQPSKRKVLNKVAPKYPDLAKLARRMQLLGKVKVEATVAPNGVVKSTHVIGGSPLLTRAAVEAVEKWKWAPAAEESKELIELSFHPE